MQFTVITRIPRKQGFLGPIPESNVVEEAEGESIDELIERLHIPLGGECLVIPKEHVTIVKSRVVNEKASSG